MTEENRGARELGHREQIREAMESCRPGSDDHRTLRRPRWPIVWALDPNWPIVSGGSSTSIRPLASAVRDVAVPDGLAERLLDRLALERRRRRPVGPMCRNRQEGLPRRGTDGDGRLSAALCFLAAGWPSPPRP